MSTAEISTPAINEFALAIRKLRVNVKSLAAEARIIRIEGKGRSGEVRHVLNLHRTGRLRDEARIAQLALAAVRGRVPYVEVEPGCRKAVPVDRVMEKVKRASSHCKEVRDWAKEWIEDAKRYLRD